MIIFGSARMNELGQLEGGQPGDQNKLEVSTQPWYLHQKGWIVIRAKDPLMRIKIAQDARWGCENDYVGYSYWEHCYTLYNEAQKYGFDYRKVKIPCETNCAKFVLGCAKYAGSKVKDFHTGNAVEKFSETGEFDILTADSYCKRPNDLIEGDILVTKTKGHIVVCLGHDTIGIPYLVANCAFCNLRKGSGVLHGVLATVKGGTRVDLLGWSPKKWGNVRYNGIEGFISPLYLEPFAQAKCKYNDTWMRDDAGANTGRQIVVIPKESTVYLTGKTKQIGNVTWYEVVYQQYTGWASGKYIRP